MFCVIVFKNHHTNMYLSVFLIFILRIIYVPFVLTQLDGVPWSICGYAGTAGNVTYNVSVSDLPDRCQAVWYNYFYFDASFADADLKAIKLFVEAKIPVIVSVSFSKKLDWSSIMLSLSTNTVEQYTGPLQKFVNDNKISGLLLEGLDLFDNNISDYSCKMNEFIKKIKTDIPTLYVGLLIAGIDYKEYCKKEFFDFSITNAEVDFYVVDLASVGLPCRPDSTDRFPISSPNEDSLEDICQAIFTSGMDQNKLIISVLGTIIKKDNDYASIEPYSNYCSRTSTNNSTYWCAESIEIFYNRGKFLKKYFKGILYSYIDMDDYDGSCECTNKFPVINAYFDGWESKQIDCCSKISGSTI